jgi:hypothetical protein
MPAIDQPAHIKFERAQAPRRQATIVMESHIAAGNNLIAEI